MRQGSLAPVLRHMRQVGMLQRFLPGFARITGMIHTVSEHRYTVDEHSILLVEAITGMGLLRAVLPGSGTSQLRADYEKLATAVGLSQYARKYAAEERMLRAIPQIRSHPAIKPFFHLLDELQENSLDYVAELNLLEYSRATCFTALRQIDEIRRQMDTLLRAYADLSFESQRELALAALLHDMDKPDPEHGSTYGPKVPECLESIGVRLPERSVNRIAWLVAHHLDLSGLLNRIGNDGEPALIGYLHTVATPEEMRALILFTHADRVAVHQDPNVTSHNTLTLTELLREVNRLEREGKVARPLVEAG
jgi:UTP:GlnB (protein PII) uridylyltransferase